MQRLSSIALRSDVRSGQTIVGGKFGQDDSEVANMRHWCAAVRNSRACVMARSRTQMGRIRYGLLDSKERRETDTFTAPLRQ